MVPIFVVKRWFCSLVLRYFILKFIQMAQVVFLSSFFPWFLATIMKLFHDIIDTKSPYPPFDKRPICFDMGKTRLG